MQNLLALLMAVASIHVSPQPVCSRHMSANLCFARARYAFAQRERVQGDIVCEGGPRRFTCYLMDGSQIVKQGVVS